ncbi:hypothetical protein NW759_002667 [Fusarium solani]|nr:hypothetical protein NW759_002667 [Fusarium solani]
MSHAADNGHVSAVSRLLERGANPNWKDLNRAPPLWYAVRYGHVAVVRVLLECGQLSDLNPRPSHPDHDDKTEHMDMTENTPLACALNNGFNEISEMLARVDGIDAHAEVPWNQSVPGLAIRNGYEGIALRLLDKYGIDKSSDYHEPGVELLVAAASIGSTKLVESLFKTHGVDLNIMYLDSGDEELEGLTPLMAAAKKGHGDVVRLLLDTEAVRPDESHDDGTALSLAAKNGLRDIVNMLVTDERIEANHKDAKGRTPLSLAAVGAHEDVVEALLMNEAVDPDCRDDEGRTPLSRATGKGYARNYNGVVRRLLADARIDPNSRDKEGNTPLYYAAENGHVSLVEAILEHPRTDLGFGDKSAGLAVAASKGHTDVVKTFLKKGRFDVNAVHLGSTPLSLAAEGGHMGMVDLLLSQPGIEAHKRDVEGRTPLAMAAWRGHTAIVERLLAVEGVDPNSRDIRGWTPLRMAFTAEHNSRLGIKAGNGFVETIGALLRAEGIDPDVADLEGRTLLSAVCEEAYSDLADLLLAFDGIDPDSRDTAGRSLLSWVVAPAQFREVTSFGRLDGRKKVMQRLLQFQAVDPNAEDEKGLTPLIRAIQGEYGNEFVQFLLEREDLDVHQRSQDGRTPMEFARKMGDTMIMSLLRKRGDLDEGNEPAAAVGKSEHSSSDDDLKDLRLPHEGGESLNIRASLKRRPSSSSSACSRSLVFGKDVGNEITFLQLGHQFARKILLPLGAQQEHLDLAKCNSIDLDKAFSVQDTNHARRVIAELKKIDETWKARECPMCRLIAAVSPCWRVAAEGDIKEEEEDDDDILASFFLKLGFIGRLGSNCERKKRAITIARVEDGVDFGAAKAWIACCREEHSERCNPRTLARVPHFRLIDCTTRRVVRPGDQVSSYVALSYVWGLTPAAGSGEKSKLKLGASDLPRDGVDIGESVEAVVEDAILVALGLGYGFL